MLRGQTWPKHGVLPEPPPSLSDHWSVPRFVISFSRIMSMLGSPVASEEAAAAIKAMDSELVFLLESSKVPKDIIAKFGTLGYTDVETFAHMEVDAPSVRDMIKSDITLDPSSGPDRRAMMARLLAVWEAAGKRTSKLKEEEAAQRASDMPRHLPKGKHLEIVRAYAAAHKGLKDKECPAPCYLEWRFEQVEDGELKAESLADVVHKEEVQDDDWGGAKVSPDGSIKLVKGRSSGKTPENPEALRAKIRLMGTAWEFVRLKFPARPYLRGLASDVWTDHVEWLLGEEVYGNVVKDASGSMTYRPSWATLLELDFRVRKQAYHLVNTSGSTLEQALRAAREDTSLIQKYFLTPVSLAAGAEAARMAVQKRPAPAEWSGPPPTRQADGSAANPVMYEHGAKGRGKRTGGRGGKGAGNRGNAKGRGKKGVTHHNSGGWSAGEQNSTPDGRLKCFRFQRGKCTDPRCDKVHSCLVCNGPHGKKDCPRRQSAGDAAGRPSHLG